VAAVEREQSQQFRVRFVELAGGLLARFSRRDSVDVDPFLVARALAEVMRRCEFRAANGRKLIWNDYRMIFARHDFELLGPFGALLDSDVRAAISTTAKSIGGDLLGPLRVTLVVDESNELPRGEAVVRTAFVPAEDLGRGAPGERTILLDPDAPPMSTAIVPDAHVSPTFGLRWATGSVALPSGVFAILGRPHPGAPARFVPLDGASAKINKQQVLLSTGASTVRVARLPDANPVHVNGRSLDPGAEVELAPPLRVSLSNDDLVIEVVRV